jgi:uncharacterized protein YxjI
MQEQAAMQQQQTAMEQQAAMQQQQQMSFANAQLGYIEFLQQQLASMQAVPFMESVVPQLGNCPPGLEYLHQLDYLKVQEIGMIKHALGGQLEQTANVLGRFPGNAFMITNRYGQVVYKAQEESYCYLPTIFCCRRERSYNIAAYDGLGRSALECGRSSHNPDCLCCICCCNCHCCADSMTCTSSNEICASISQKSGLICAPNAYTVKNSDGASVLQIKEDCSSQPGFSIYDSSGSSKLGRINKLRRSIYQRKDLNSENGGMERTPINSYEIHFPVDMDIKAKAACLSFVFLYVCFS